MKVSSEMLSLCVQEDLRPFLGRGPEGDWRCFASEALMSSLNKKNVENVDKEADERALKLFLDVNEGLRQSILVETLTDEYLIGELKQELYRFWYRSGGEPIVTSFAQLVENGKLGPGVSQGSEHCDFYSKLFNCKLTAPSSLLYKEFRAALLDYPLWDAAEKCRADHFGEHTVVEHNKLSFVPKRYDISRTVCPESIVGMFLQLGFGYELCVRLAEMYAIDLALQPDHNRELARRGSIDGDFATIDLSSASDSLSLGVLKELLPPDWFWWLSKLRTPNVKLPDGKIVKLKMVSTMGNGFTFPMETVLFAAIVVVCYRLTDLKAVRNHGRKTGNWGVFGDDIIVRKEAYYKVLRLLHLLGFKVNTDKTFVEGPFRESCGSDWYQGHFVRGVYVKRLTSVQDRYAVINLLNDWSAYTGIPLCNAIGYLLKTVVRVVVPPSCGVKEGIHVPASLSGAKRVKHGAYKFRFFRAVASKDEVSGVDGSVAGRELINPLGLVVSFFAGYIRSQSIGRRQRSVRYVVEERGLTPSWDTFSRTSAEEARDELLWEDGSYRKALARHEKRVSFPRWQTAVFINLFQPGWRRFVPKGARRRSRPS